MVEPTSNSDSTQLNASPSLGVFVGRQREMAGLRTVLDDAISGQGRLVMLTGEPGIGKTRVAQELAGAAESQGMRVFWGRCYEGLGAPPFWPWVQPIREYVQQADPETLRSEMGPGAADIAAIIPEVTAKLPGLDEPPQLDPDQARFRLFDSIATFLKNSAASSPLALVLDDLHWADRSSLHLLEFLVKEIATTRLLVIGTYRDLELTRQHPLEESLAQLVREPVFHRYSLQGLSPEDTRRLIEVASQGVPSQGVVAAIHTHTEGNPFFLAEVIRLLTDNPEAQTLETGDVSQLAIPAGIREVIGRRLNRLSDSCNQMLSAASVAGREFEFALLRELLPQTSENQLLEAIDEALWARLIGEMEGGRERYQFSHALVQQTIFEELSASRRVRLHARIAGWLEIRHEASASEYAGELAYHFGEAQSVLEEGVGTEKLAHYSLLAGEQALDGYLWEEALSYFQRGLSAKGVSPAGTEPAEDGEAAALLFGIGRAQWNLVDGSVELRGERIAITLARALDYYLSHGESSRAAAVATTPASTSRLSLLPMAPLVNLALGAMPPGSPEEGRVLSRHGVVLTRVHGDYTGASEAFGRALAIAERTGDRILQIQTLANAIESDFFHIRFNECIANGLKVLPLTEELQAPIADLTASLYIVRSLGAIGDSAGARRHATKLLPKAEQTRDPWWLTSAQWVNQIVSCLEGDWPTAREIGERALRYQPDNPRILGAQALLEYQQGNFDEGSSHVARLFEAMRRSRPGPITQYGVPAIVAPLIASITGVSDDLETASAAADTVLSSEHAPTFYRVTVSAGLALAAVQKSDLDLCTRLYGTLLDSKGTMPMFTPSPSIDRVLGLVSQTVGKEDQANAHFEDALGFCRKAGYRPELAWTCHDYADALLRSEGHSPKAMSLLDESFTICTDLGMRPLAEKVTALQESGRLSPERRPNLPDGLTQREAEVLRLVAAGKTDREIADELMIAPRTATTHVGHILSKTDSANRAEAASYATRQGLA